jgi:N utilization substance protein B
MTMAEERAAARLAAVQALYQMDVSGKGVIDALAEFEAFWIGRDVEGIEARPSDRSFFRSILSGVVENQRSVDVKIDRALTEGWPLRRVEAVLRAILRAGVFELMYRKDVPARVVITEYVDVAHGFYGEDEPGFVNAVLDAIAREVRPGELESRGTGAGRSRGDG